MFESRVLQEASYRHASFYLSQLRQANQLFRQGGTRTRAALAQVDAHWSQITHGQSWTAQRAQDQQALSLCSAYAAEVGDLLHMRQPITERIAWLEAGLAAAQRLQEEGIALSLLNKLGHAHVQHGDLTAARQRYAAVLAALNTKGDTSSLELGDALLGAGRIDSLKPSGFAQAQQQFTQALAIFQAHHDRQRVGWCLQNIGGLLERMGDLDGAQAQVEAALAIYRELDNVRYAANALKRLGSIAERRGDYPAARALLHDALSFARETRDQQMICEGLQILGLVCSNEGDQTTARAHFVEALHIARQQVYQDDIARCHINLGWIANAQGDQPEALRQYEAALEICRRTQHQRTLAITLVDVARLRKALGQPETVNALLDEAEEIARAIGLTELHAYADELRV